MGKAEANARLDELFSDIDGLVGTCDIEHVRAHCYRLLRSLSALEHPRPVVELTQAERIAHEARRLLMEGLGTHLTIESVAAACKVSPTMLKDSFRATYGVPLGTWWRTWRIEQAQRQLLETDDTIAEVAASVGYLNPSKFSHAFRMQTGESPSDWRRAHQ